MKFVLTTEYDTELKDWDINRIQMVEKSYNNILRGIQRQEQKLLGNIPGPSILPNPLFNETQNSPPMPQVSLHRLHMK